MEGGAWMSDTACCLSRRHVSDWLPQRRESVTKVVDKQEIVPMWQEQSSRKINEANIYTFAVDLNVSSTIHGFYKIKKTFHMLSNLETRSVWSVNENMYMRCLWSVKRTNVHASLFLRVCVHSCMSAHTSIMSLWSLQSNSFRQKSLKQPLVSGLHAIPPSVSSLLNSHQPLLLPKITQERHSNPRLTTAQLGRKRGIKTHTKKETHHIVEGGEKEHSYCSMLEDIYWWFWQAKNHTH